MGIEVNGTTYETDEEGYLVNLADWNKDIAEAIAKAENVEMSENHWEVVNFLREYYDEYQIAPAVRVLRTELSESYEFDTQRNAMEAFATSLDPYPKREGVSFEWSEAGAESGPADKPESPFAVLKQLK